MKKSTKNSTMKVLRVALAWLLTFVSMFFWVFGVLLSYPLWVALGVLVLLVAVPFM